MSSSNGSSGEDIEYECTLTAEDIKYAFDKLHEEPMTRTDNVKLLQLWVQDRPHLHAHAGK